MLKIRLQRTGRKHETTFRVVLTDSKNSTKSGKYKEILGSYDPRKDEKNTILKGDRIKHWLGVGAEATGTVHNLLISHKIIDGKKTNVLPKKTYVKKEEAAPPAANDKVEEAPKEEEGKVAETEPQKEESSELPVENATKAE